MRSRSARPRERSRSCSASEIAGRHGPDGVFVIHYQPTYDKSQHERHCAQTGATRSRVVQQSMAQYLVAQSGPTLGELAEALLPPVAKRRARAARPSRQQRFRDYVRDKRHR